jgi:hypothetical protein
VKVLGCTGQRSVSSRLAGSQASAGLVAASLRHTLWRLGQVKNTCFVAQCCRTTQLYPRNSSLGSTSAFSRVSYPLRRFAYIAQASRQSWRHRGMQIVLAVRRHCLNHVSGLFSPCATYRAAHRWICVQYSRFTKLPDHHGIIRSSTGVASYGRKMGVTRRFRVSISSQYDALVNIWGPAHGPQLPSWLCRNTRNCTNPTVKHTRTENASHASYSALKHMR